MTTGTFVLVAVTGTVAAVATFVTLWLRERRRTRLLLLGDERRLTQIGELERVAHAAEGETELRRQLVRDRDTARSWVRRLRHELADAQTRAGVIGDPGDIYELVLRTAVELLGAKRGLLLARRDGDGDGDLDLVCSLGFDESPEHLDVVQQLASKTLAAEETLRVDDTGDDEVETLVAIPVYILDRFHGVLVAADKPGGFRDYDDEVLLALGDHAGAALHNARLHGRLRNAYISTVRMLADALEAKDPFLRGHSDQVSDLVAGVARGLELRPKEREELVFASLLHDIGKIGISESILLKPGPLTAEERALVQLHPRIGYRLVESIPDLRPIALAILHHHERFDGGGYPTGLRGDQIPLDARVIAIADAFSAMTSERPYGERLSAEDACAELKRCAGTQFDPELVRLFCEEVEHRSDLDEPGLLDRALDDPELTAHLAPGEPILGRVALSATDGTTLAYSHSHLHREARALAQSCALNGRTFAVIVAELTNLERVNRDEGFAAGDDLLRCVAEEAERLASRVGGLVARLSGRRIAVLVPGAGEREAQQLADDLQPPASISVRCAAWQAGDTGDDVIARARAATAPVA